MPARVRINVCFTADDYMPLNFGAIPRAVKRHCTSRVTAVTLVKIPLNSSSDYYVRLDLNNPPDGYCEIRLPDKAQQWMHDLTHLNFVNPIRFRLDAIPGVLEATPRKWEWRPGAEMRADDRAVLAGKIFTDPAIVAGIVVFGFYGWIDVNEFKMRISDGKLLSHRPRKRRGGKPPVAKEVSDLAGLSPLTLPPEMFRRPPRRILKQKGSSHVE